MGHRLSGTSYGVVAHSALTGLATGDDHTQYLLVAGTRDGTGAWRNLAALTSQVAVSNGTGTEDGLVAENTTAATAGNQKYSPLNRQRGNGWKTNATAGSQSVEFATQVRPVQGAAAPTGATHWLSQINGGGWTSRMNLDSAGLLTTTLINNGDGAVGAPSYSFTSAPTTGFYFSSSAMRLALSGAERFNASTSGFAFGLVVTPMSDNATDLGATATRWKQGFFSGYLEMSEIAAPTAPGADKGRLYLVDNGSGKTQLAIIFSSGAAQVIATQP